MNDSSLLELLVQSREKNKRLAITGMLVHFSGLFVQLIEGEERKVVKQLETTIRNDPRHEYFMTKNEGRILQRFFPDWSMGFKSVNPANMLEVESFIELNNPNEKNIANLIYLIDRLTNSSR